MNILLNYKLRLSEDQETAITDWVKSIDQEPPVTIEAILQHFAMQEGISGVAKLLGVITDRPGKLSYSLYDPDLGHTITGDCEYSKEFAH